MTPDADGLVSATIMRKYLKSHGIDAEFIYGERSHGHGIAEMIKVNKLIPEGINMSVDELYDSDVVFEKRERFNLAVENSRKIHEADLLILIDSSSNDAHACKFIQDKLGVEVIIIDHHIVEKRNSHCLMVNPNNPDCDYPNKYLSGAGVVYKTLEVIEDKTGETKNIKQYLDLVAVGLLGDLMNVTNLENRYLIYKGMSKINNTGLLRICKGAKVDTFGGIRSDDVGFSIAPIINAVARMDNIKLAIDILMEDDDNKCKPIRLKMHKLNELRKKTQKEITEKYISMLTEEELSRKVIIIGDEESGKGFNGLVAQNISVMYNKPVIIGRVHNGELSGSFRAPSSIKFKSISQEFGDVFSIGHEQAGGISIKCDMIDEFKDFLDDVFQDYDNTVEQVSYYDLQLSADNAIDYMDAIQEFNKLSGQGFPKVIVRIDDLTVQESNVIGATKETVKISTLEDFVLIKFRVSEAEEFAENYQTFDSVAVVGEMLVNAFYNFKERKHIFTNQIILSDIVPC